ncbi:dethiobiotin synthase [Flavihumibacter rivuli]|uniref:dethiobiotin synthase n=1 Tax=Flavihumibacter rivuli TaxID=2838156 RepID=UPI001BDF4938|nr:dethiobiotin synthase [Flavihumibacter rivuli]ULQ57724.1 dethiobiotin synthase [Flavihumibacter rivuli]
MQRPIFITGIGTGVGKTMAAAVLAEALEADYWKPVQAGEEDGTDRQWVGDRLSNSRSVIHPEAYKLKLPASPHIAAREEGISIRVEDIVSRCPVTPNRLIIEGAGGLLVPINGKAFIADLILALNARVVLVSRNYLGSINHSLLTAEACKTRGIEVAGWIFNDQYMDYEKEIVNWTGIPSLGSIPFSQHPDKSFVQQQAAAIKPFLSQL